MFGKNKTAVSSERKRFRLLGTDTRYGGNHVTRDEEEGNLLSSECEDGFHRPVIDLDFDCELVPSSTPGHYHLYLNKPITWTSYLKLLETLHQCSYIDTGWLKNARADKRTYVRVKGFYKQYEELKERILERGKLFEE